MSHIRTTPPCEDGSVKGRDEATAATKLEGQARTAVDPAPAGEAADSERLGNGTQVGRYVIVNTLGAGGMGVVYAAFDPELDRKVAIKFLQARPGGSETGGQTWLIREAQAMARLAHPNVVAIYDVGAISGDRVFLAMELVDGVTLREWLEQPRRWREVLAVMRAAGAGLAAAHAAGLVHRDFKPDNVLVGTDGRTRVMDFGLARLEGDVPATRESDLSIEARSPLSERLTVTGAVLGTPAYMAPEIYRGQGTDARADQFAFGVALYEALYRKRPFDRVALVEQRATAPKPPPSDVPAWLERVVLRVIALDPDQRYASMDELLVALAADPSGRRRIALGATGVLALGTVAVFALVRGGDKEPAAELCTGAEAQLAGTWDPGARTALEAAFKKLDKPFVADAIKATETGLDAYATSWTEMRTEACRATRVLGHQAEDVMTLRMQCLDLRATELRALTGLFAKADASTVHGAVSAVQKLSPIADCADVPALLAPDPLPKDPVARDKIIAVQAKLAEARAVYKASRPADAYAILQPLERGIGELEHRPTKATFHFLNGQTLWVLQGPDKGEPELQAAAFNAAAGKADELELDAWLSLTNLAIERAKFDVAKERWTHASATLARLGGRWELEVRVLASQALLQLRQSKHEDAIAIIKRARAIVDVHPNTTAYGYALLVEATILSASGRAAEAVEVFRKVLAYQRTLGNNRIEVAAIVQNMATAEAQVGHSKEAIDLSKQAVEISASIYGSDSGEVAMALNTLAAAQAMTGELAATLETNQRALAIAKRTAAENDQLYASTLGQLAGTLVALNRPKEALPYLDTAEQIHVAKVGPGHVQTLTIVLTKCDALRAAKQLKAAIRECERAVANGEASLGKTNPLLFLFLGHLGETLLEAKQAKRATVALDRALALGATNPADLYVIAFLDAQAHRAAGNRARAIELATKARDGFRSLGEVGAASLQEAERFLRKR